MTDIFLIIYAKLQVVIIISGNDDEFFFFESSPLLLNSLHWLVAIEQYAREYLGDRKYM